MPPLSASQVWHALSQRRQWQILRQLLTRLHRSACPPGVVNIGIGYRTLTSPDARKRYRQFAGKRRTKSRGRILIASRKHPRVLTSELCVRFYVEAKLKRPTHPLPKYVVTRTRFRGKARVC